MRTKIIIYTLLIIFPFIALAPLTFQYIEVGNDFELYYFVYKKYIFEFLKSGHFPLWSPVEAAGYSLIFNPLAQPFYFPSWILYLFSFLIGDLSKYSFLIYTISAISIFNVGLFLYLRTFNINYKIILTTVLITSFSLKVTELLRFPNALHAFAWFPWILYGINSVLLNTNYKKNFLIIFVSCLMLLTAGYPYYIFYGTILFLSYFIFLLIIPNKENFFFEKNSKILPNKKFFLKCFYPSFLAIVVSSPWILKISQLMNITRGRNISDYSFSTQGSTNLYDQLGSWIYPPISIAEGWYYFGAASIFLIIIIFIFTIFFNRKNDFKLKYFFYFFIFLIFFNYQFANPINSIIFPFIWKNLEFIQSFRFWMRMNIILVPIISLLLALSISKFISILDENNLLIKKKLNQIIVSVFIIIFLSQLYLINFSGYENLYWEAWQLKRIIYAENLLPEPFSNIVSLYKSSIYPISFLFTFILFFLINKFDYIYNFFKKSKNIFLFSILFLSFFELFLLTNIQWSIPYRYYENGYQKLNLKKDYNAPNNNILGDVKNAFFENRVSTAKSGNNKYEGNTYYRNNKKFNINYINTWGNEGHTKIFDKYFYQNGKFKENVELIKRKEVEYFYGMDSFSKKIFYSKTLSHNNIFSFLNDSRLSESQNEFSFELIKYNGDELIIIVNSSSDGWISFIDTWDSNWKVFINKKEKNLEKLLNSYKSVKINSGKSEVRFVYKPFNFYFK